ncbi:M1 family metallopeptidase [Croceicoccus marinus]|uniref:M1 family metallopeptidase n=1 Tax=Croceicoccus marinus TaxID=450378 RepID=UPI000A050807|nr:M1 family metallopeptidase [Croceicoccus marinus]
MRLALTAPELNRVLNCVLNRVSNPVSRGVVVPALASLALTGCAATQSASPLVSSPLASSRPLVSPILTSPEARDTSTYARPEEARVTHVALDLALNFEAKDVFGTATLDIMADDDADTVVLDSDGLRISAITDEQGNALPYTVGEHDEELGEPITVRMGAARRITVTYRAAPDAAALQWLDPEQTAGGEHPYLFSQGQAILNRTWIPTQDSPGIRQTWEARITAPKPLTVVMSGLSGSEPVEVDGDRRAFTFSMDKPVPPYLIALAAGDIAFRELGPRTGVWTEPVMLDRAAAELADTEAMVAAAEKLYGDYRWGRYDMIVLPPAFPYGGMENPVMTFLTPTFIAGDRSLTGLVAHELAHSWSGNLVTNSNWRDSWLNEGVTSYFEGRITEEIYGEQRARQEEALSFATVENVLAEAGANDPGTALHQPDDVESAGSEIVYDKGAAFLRTVEQIAGRERFDAWLRQWFDNHAFQPATSQMILADMQANLVAGDEELGRRLMLREWIFEPGLPANVKRPDPQAFAGVDGAAARYAATRQPDAAAWQGWNSAERLRFLSKLPDEMSAAQLAALDSAFGLSGSGNNEVLFAWLRTALSNRYEPAVPVAEAFLARVGRMKFVAPLFGVLMGEGEWGQPIARRIYAATYPSYHAVTRGAVDRAMKAGD